MKIRGFEVVSNEFREYPKYNIKLPQRGTKYSAGYDFFCPINIGITPGKTIKIKTDIKAYMLNDEYLDINIRSSIAINKHLRIKNIVGIIDSDYYSNKKNDGNIIIPLKNESNVIVFLTEGERIAQGIFKKYLLADNDMQLSKERIGGIGSTDTK